MKKEVPDFMVIDDDPVNNTLCSVLIRMTMPGATVHTFTRSDDLLGHIRASYTGEHKHRSDILFLDIDMPVETGWSVLKKYNAFPDEVKKQLSIYILSSSVNPRDRKEAEHHTDIYGYITKPLTKVKLEQLFPEYIAR